MKDIILFPFNGNAKEAASVIADINKDKKTWNLLGFIDDDPDARGKNFSGIPVLGGREHLKRHPGVSVLAVPGRPDNFMRRQEIILSLGIAPEQLATIIHPTAVMGLNVEVGRNCLIMPGVVITADVRLGNHVVILPHSVISHDSVINDYVMIGSNVSVSGRVTIGACAYIGTGTKIIQEITIGEKALVGMGAVVIRSVADGDVVAGNPAIFLKKAVK